jgi:pectinesterase
MSGKTLTDEEESFFDSLEKQFIEPTGEEKKNTTDPDKLSPMDQLSRIEFSDVLVETDVVYHTVGGRELRCDIYSKPSAEGFPSIEGGKRVGVCVIYGGGWIQGDKSVPYLYGCELARAGYVAVVPEYRLAPKDRWPAMLHDCKACVRWMRAEATRLNISADHIATQGNSAGGQLALMLAGTSASSHPEFEGESAHNDHSSAVQACVAVYPCTDARSTRGHDRASLGIAKLVREMVMREGHTRKELEEFSPIVHVHADFPPTCFLHGNADSIVSPLDSMNMYSELHRLGAHAELHMIAHAPHSISRDPLLGGAIHCTMLTFFDRLFRPEATAFMIDPRAQAGVVQQQVVQAAQAALEAKAATRMAIKSRL